MIAIGCDHGGYALKQEIIQAFDSKGISYIDFGTHDEEAVDYPDYAKQVCRYVLEHEKAQGILICGTGIGISIAANRHKGIRAALCHDCFSAEATKLHNSANVLCLGGRVVGPGLALKIVDTFINTDFSNEERHRRRVEKIED
ncbi:ribose 5-phosphate isomerase B [Petrocella sp. FN5]|uniref:ribose 5-phosphate isomerase B n=1 Tax=Petrocella sp. FN5 TaxID=3032002 RepID=UPI0023D99CB9|nr:ribose 5-phosphate isomerase B [Petrocella sp. FN5]MDF1617110.1 ribose 5-phosphate isomerase B [Petrocella sp. FN5]